MSELTKRIRLERDFSAPFILQERWDKQMLDWILARPSAFLRVDGEVDHFLFQQLVSINGRIKQNDLLDVNYEPCSKAVPFDIEGRLFAHQSGGGFQSVSGWVRRLCSHKFYHDLDIVNCYPVILLQLAKRHGIYGNDLGFLERYVQCREEILAADMEIIDGLSCKDAKSQYLKLMFGSNQMLYETSFLINFKKEVEYITESLWRMSEYQKFRFYAQSNTEEGKSVKGSFLSVSIQAVERKIINTAMETLTDEFPEFNVGVYVFDGFMVSKNADREFPQSILVRLSERVKEVTSFQVEFVEKPLKPTEKDFLHVRPAFNNFMVESQWTGARVFNHLEIMANELNKTPQPENEARFKAQMLPVMNEAFALVKDKMLLVAERVFDKHGAVNYVYRKWRDALEIYQSKIIFINNGEKQIPVELLEVWGTNKYALSYTNLVFNPREYNELLCASPLELNSFVGLNYSPTKTLTAEELTYLRANELKTFWEHVRLVWCRGNEEIFIYVHNWLCSRVQRPGYKIQTCITLRSKEGAGKGVVIDKVAEILGSQYVSVPPSLEHITGEGFNREYFERCLMMFLDECFYAGSKATKNQLKTKITAPFITINEKYMPQYRVENFATLILASNEDHVINRDIQSRRFLCLNLDNKYAGIHAENSPERAYFNEILATDPQVLCNYMCSVDLDGWSGRAIPTTLEGETQALLSMSMEQRFVHEILADPGIIQEAKLEYQRVDEQDRKRYLPPDDADALEGLYVKSVLHSLFSKHVNHKSGPQKCFNIIKEMIPGVVNDTSKPRIHGKQVRLLMFPKLEVARNAYKIQSGLQHYRFSE